MNIRNYRKWLDKYREVGNGWKPLIISLCDKIITIDDTVEVVQVKEKFGGLGFYIYGDNEEIDDLINKAEDESYKICGVCGTRRNVTTKGSWLLTLCNK